MAKPKNLLPFVDVVEQTSMTTRQLVKQVLDVHPTLHPLAEGDNSFTMDLGDNGLVESMKLVRTTVDLIADAMWKDITPDSGTMGSQQVPSTTTGYELAAKRAFAIRALKHVSKNTSATSSRNLVRFSTRMISNYDIADHLSITNTAMEKFESSQGYIQVKRDPTETNPMLWSWLIVLDGVTLTRGKQLPIAKLITSLTKPLQLDTVMNGNTVQALIITLSKTTVTDKKYYWYLTNQSIAAHYIQFRKTKSTDSCMSKSSSYYQNLNGTQHPMQCYDHSPDWSLMFISDKSPFEIAQMLDDTNDVNFKYPFLTRCMVLPREKEEYRDINEVATPFIFGKIYGLEKIVNYFFKSGSDGRNLNSNPLLTHQKNIAGGRIHRLKIVGKNNQYMLPYFDQANKAFIRNDEDGHWWVSTHESHYTKVARKNKDHDITSIWRGQYQYGSARSVSVHSNMHNGFRTAEVYDVTMVDTVLGREADYIVRNYYHDVKLVDGNTMSVPSDWSMSYGSGYYLRSETTTALDGSVFPKALLNIAPDRYKLDEVYGIFDLNNREHAARFANLGLKA